MDLEKLLGNIYGIMNLFHFFSSFNTAYNNKFRFFYFKNVPKLNHILNLFVRMGLILGFFFIHKIVVVSLKYLNDVPFFKVVMLTKPSRRFYFNTKKIIKGRLSGNNYYILNSPKKGFYFSQNFKETNILKEGGEVLMKIVFNNENNFSKKNNFI